MSEIDPMDTDELSGTEAVTDAVDATYDGYAATADYTDTTDEYTDTTSVADTSSYDGTQTAPDTSVAETIVDDPVDASAGQPTTEPVAAEPEIALVDPVATATPTAPGTSSELTAPAPPAPVDTTAATSALPYDAPTSATLATTTEFDDVEAASYPDPALDDWQSAYDEWQNAVTTTGHAPLIGGDHLADTDVDDVIATPSTTEMDGVVGEPFADREFWFRQTETFSCGPATAAQILSDFTDTPVDERALIDQVTDNKWWVDENRDGVIDGMSIQNLSQLMANNGVANQVIPGDVDDLELYLSQGRSIVLFLDNENLPGMQELDGAENSAADDPNHFVRLTGIDTARGVAYLSDPGRADGQTLVVPLDMLKEAWNDSNNYMVVTELADPTADSTGTPTTGTPTTGTPTTGTPTTGTPTTTGTETPTTTGTETTPATTTAAPQADRGPAPAEPPAPQARPAAASTPSVVRTETVTTSMTPPADVAPLDLGVSDQINDMLQTAADAATPPVDLTTPSSQPDGLFDSALGFVLIPVAVSAGVAGTLGYRQLRSNR